MRQKLAHLANNTFASLKIRNYRLYFFGQAISMSGLWMQTVALGWLALELTGSGAQLGGIVAMQFIPILLFGPWGGIVADRFDKRRTFFFTQSLFGVLALLMGLLVLSGAVAVWMLYAYALIIGFIKVIDEPSRQTFVFEMVDSDHIKNAVSLNASLNNLSRVVGPSIAGFLILGVGIGFCFILNAFSYLGIVLALRRMRLSELRRTHHGERRPGQLAEGFRYALSNPLIRNTLFLMALIGMFAYEWQVSLPLIAQRTFGGDAASYASLMAALGAGSVIGGLFAASRQRIAPHHLIGYVFLFGLSMIVTSRMPTIELAALGMIVVGFFSINVTSLANTMIQLESAHEMRGRVMSLWGMAMQGSTPIGGPVIGLVGEYFGARWGLAVGGISALVAAGISGLPLLAKDILRYISDDADIEEESASSNIK